MGEVLLLCSSRELHMVGFFELGTSVGLPAPRPCECGTASAFRVLRAKDSFQPSLPRALVGARWHPYLLGLMQVTYSQTPSSFVSGLCVHLCVYSYMCAMYIKRLAHDLLTCSVFSLHLFDFLMVLCLTAPGLSYWHVESSFVVALKIFSYSLQILSCGMWD